MPTYVVRVWVPDRPGALGAVASRIGAVKGDLVGVDILERGAGRAIDELVVELPQAGLLNLMVDEVNEVDGVDVEDVREVPAPADPRLDALETAAYLVERDDPADLVRALVAHAVKDFEANWAAVVDRSAPKPIASAGAMPPEAWVFAFVRGASLCESGGPAGGPSDVAWADMSVAGLVLVVGREGRPWRTRERRQLAALSKIADSRWAELVSHPRRGASRPSARLHPATAKGNGRLEPGAGKAELRVLTAET
jgi:hypothetical protein